MSPSLVTCVVEGCPLPWTMSVMPDEDEADPRLQEDRLRAAISLIEEDDVILYGVWGDARYHQQTELKITTSLTSVIFRGAQVLAVYQ